VTRKARQPQKQKADTRCRQVEAIIVRLAPGGKKVADGPALCYNITDWSVAIDAGSAEPQLMAMEIAIADATYYCRCHYRYLSIQKAERPAIRDGVGERVP